jgi:hypothetical protein
VMMCCAKDGNLQEMLTLVSNVEHYKKKYNVGTCNNIDR